MKKFYENPVVEITVFDVEDVITTSLASTLELTEGAAEDLVAAIEAGAQIDNLNVIAAKKYSAYNW